MSSVRRVQVSLAEEQYARLQRLAEKRDVTVADLVRRAITQVYMDDLALDVSTSDVQRLGEMPLLMDEDEEEIGIRGTRTLPEQHSGGHGPEGVER